MQSRRGFTVIELLIVVFVMAILAGFVSLALAGVLQRTSMDQSERMLSSMLSRARAMAIESGQVVELHIDGPGDRAYVARNDTTFASFIFDDELGIDVNLDGGGAGKMCMGPTGVAVAGCDNLSGRFIASTGETINFSITAGGALISG